MIKLTTLLNESLESEYPEYMYSPKGFGCHVCHYYKKENGQHICTNDHYQEYIKEKFPELENPAQLVDQKGNPIKDPSKWCSNWFKPNK